MPRRQIEREKKQKQKTKLQVRSVQSYATLLFHSSDLPGCSGAPVIESGYARWILQGLG